jgi:hypothetical protein
MIIRKKWKIQIYFIYIYYSLPKIFQSV